MLNDYPRPRHFNIIPRRGIIVTRHVLPKTRHVLPETRRVLPETRRVLVVMVIYARKYRVQEVQEVQVLFLLRYYMEKSVFGNQYAFPTS